MEIKWDSGRMRMGNPMPMAFYIPLSQHQKILARFILREKSKIATREEERESIWGEYGHVGYADLNPLSNARKITSSFCAWISFADKEEKPSLVPIPGSGRLFLTQYAGRESQIPIMDAA